MLSSDVWTNMLLVCTALLALYALVRQTVKGLQYMWRSARKFGELMDQWLGDKATGRPSLMEVLEETRADGQATKKQVAHIEAAQSRIEARIEAAFADFAAQLAEHKEQGHPAAAIPITREATARRGGRT